MQMKRVVVFLPSAAVKACDTLATRYASNRSEVVRLAVAEGMPGAVEALERLRRASPGGGRRYRRCSIVACSCGEEASGAWSSA
jgi:hypothetical protein